MLYVSALLDEENAITVSYNEESNREADGSIPSLTNYLISEFPIIAEHEANKYIPQGPIGVRFAYHKSDWACEKRQRPSLSSNRKPSNMLLVIYVWLRRTDQVQHCARL